MNGCTQNIQISPGHMEVRNHMFTYMQIATSSASTTVDAERINRKNCILICI